MDVKLLDFQTVSDHRGDLSFFESGVDKQVPFEIKRVYYIYNTNEQPRGFHAHKDLLQIMIVLRGSCDVLLDDGHDKQWVTLSKPTQGLFIDKMMWHEIHNFSDDFLVIIFASNYYDESDYIRDYNEFLNLVR